MIFFLLAINYTFFPYAYNFGFSSESKDRIYIASDNGGIVIFSPEAESFDFITTRDGLNTLQTIKTYLYNDSIFILTLNGMQLFNKDKIFIKDYTFFLPLFPDTFANSITIRNEIVYLGFKNGISYFPLDAYPESTQTKFYPFQVRDIEFFSDSIYLATSNGIYKTTNFSDTVLLMSGNFSFIDIFNDSIFVGGESGFGKLYDTTGWYSGEVYNAAMYEDDIIINAGKYIRSRNQNYNAMPINISTSASDIIPYKNSLYIPVKGKYIIRYEDGGIVGYYTLSLPRFIPGSDFEQMGDGSIWVTFGAGSYDSNNPYGLVSLSEYKDGKWIDWNYSNEWGMHGRLWQVEKDSKGKLWFGLWYWDNNVPVVFRWTPEDTISPQSVNLPISVATISCIKAGPGDTIWIAALGSYIFKAYYSGDSINWQTYNDPSITWTRYIAFDASGTPFFGTGSSARPNGVYYLKDGIFHKVSGDFGSMIYALKADNFGSIWVGSENGLSHIENYTIAEHFDYENSGLYPGPVNGITFDKEGELWVFQSGEGVVYRNTAGFWERIPELRGVRNNAGAYPLFTDRNGNIWVGSFNGMYKISIGLKPMEYKSIVFPNPYISSEHHWIKITMDGLKNLRVVIFNASGKSVFDTSAVGDTVTITKDLYPGIYLYRIIGNSGVVDGGKFMVIK